ncbi:hypothetical protein HOF92_13500 [bacterium]|jgi:hypothetical protein|nr:hypothetical protein [bacterium]
MKNSIKLLCFSALMSTFLFTPASMADATQKEWTFLIFLNADNNLDRFGVNDVHEMEAVGSTDQVNIVVQFDRAYGKPAKRLYVKQGESDVVEEMGEVDMGDIDVFTDFVAWGTENYPAKKYAVVMWNHGSGWNKRQGDLTFKGISYDDQSGNHITTAQLGDGLKTIKENLGRNLDILAFDACLMQMVEVAYAIRHEVDIMLASEEVEPGEGWAYTDSMQPIIENPTMTPGETASVIVDTYDASYDGGSQGNRSTTQSWVRLSAMDTLISTLNAAAVELTGNFTNEMKATIKQVQKFYYRSNVDLVHFLALMHEKISGSESETANKAEILATLNSAKAAAQNFVGHSASHGSSMSNSHGVAIYVPGRGYSFSKKYKDLDFAKDNQWDEMLKAYYDRSKTTLADL